MLGVEHRTDFRRASLVSEIYSETHAPTSSASGIAPALQQAAAAPGANPNNGAKLPASIRPPAVMPGMRRKVPKGKFGLIGLGTVQKNKRFT